MFLGMNDETDSIETAAKIKLTFNAARNVFIYGFYAVLIGMIIVTDKLMVAW